ncbi:hypothetical protein BSKO_13338 [Bryopsis sp. KO-2023]|nr:hypothetical protein BSKO_13338 [Bryopsis sp. KO-2023]
MRSRKSAAIGKHEDSEQIQEVVDSAIDSNDILPLVRLVFEGVSEVVSSPTSTASGQAGTGDIVKACLESIVADEDDAAAQICRGNTETIAESMDQLDSMQMSAQQLANDIWAVNAELQNAGQALMHRLKEVGDLQEVEDRLLATGRALQWTCAVLERCTVVCQNIEQHKLYHALKILEDIQTNMIPDDGKKSSKPLKGFLEKVINDLAGVVQKLAISDFNDWLVSARAEARQIGLQAIRRAAILRQHEERCGLERNTILESIKSGQDLLAAVALSTPSLRALETLSETASRPTFQSMDVTATSEALTGQDRAPQKRTVSIPGDEEHWEVASVVLSEAGRASATASRSGTSILQDSRASEKPGMNMRGLHRCIHVHQCLGRIVAFRDYYMQQRRMQMDSDLRPPANFLEVYQSYLAQVTGFFIIEDNVQRMTEDLIDQHEVDALWEMATATLKSVVDSAFESMNSAAAMLLVKDFLLLVCSGLSKSGYPAANLKEILSSNMGKYHNLMNVHVGKEVARIWDADEQERVGIRSEKNEREIITDLGLPTSLESWEPPTQFPYRAPFTSMVPHIIWLVQEYVRDSVAYLKGLINPGDVLSASCLNRDRMIKVTVDAIQLKLHGLSAEGCMLKESMQLVTNMWSLTYGLAALEEWTVTQVVQGGGSSELDGGAGRKPGKARASPGSHLHTLMRSVEDSSERLVLRIVGGKIEELLQVVKGWEWTPKTSPPAATSPVIEELMIYLQGVFDLSRETMPRDNADTLVRSSLQVVGSSLTNVLTGTEVPMINDNGFQRLLGDATALERFAERCPVGGSGHELAQCREICQLIVNGKLEEAADPSKLKRTYPNIDITVLVSVLDKYRDVGGGMSNFLTSKTGRAQPRRKDMEQLAKHLRDKMIINRSQSSQG